MSTDIVLSKNVVLTRSVLNQSRDDPVIHSKNSRAHLVEEWRSAGEKQRNWKSKIRRVTQATTHLSGERQVITSSPGSAVLEYYTSKPLYLNDQVDYYRYRSHSGDLGYLHPEVSLDPLSSLDLAENVARERFYADIRQKQTAFTGGVFVGELRRAVKMIRSPAMALRKRVHYLYKRIFSNWKRSRKQMKTANRIMAETWLEGSYGWAPLINDIKNGHEALHDLTKNQKYNQFVFLRGFGDNNTSSRQIFSESNGALRYNLCFLKKRENIVHYRGVMAIEVENPYMSESRYWGFSPNDIIPTVWELTPYSFLIDYFSNIGKVLDAYSVLRTRLRWGARTQRQAGIVLLEDAVSTIDLDPDAIIISHFVNSGSLNNTKSSFTRTPISQVPIPDFRFKLPNSSTKWINIAALVALRSRNVKTSSFYYE